MMRIRIWLMTANLNRVFLIAVIATILACVIAILVILSCLT